MTKRRFALVFLVASVLALGAAARVPATLAPATHGLQLRLVSGMAERLTVAPVGIAASADALQARPGADGVLGHVALTPQTRHPVLLSVRALPSARDLDGAILASVTVDRMPVARTTLGRLRAGTVPIRLRPGRTVTLGVRLWLTPGTSPGAYAGRRLDVILELQTDPLNAG
jgi:hypothetical protein